jgi:hypothetical protein
MRHVIFLLKNIISYLEANEDAFSNEYGEVAFIFTYLEKITKLSKCVSLETEERFIKIMSEVKRKFENGYYKDLDDVLKDLFIIYNIMKEIYVKQKVLELLWKVCSLYDWEDRSLEEKLKSLIGLIDEIFVLGNRTNKKEV